MAQTLWTPVMVKAVPTFDWWAFWILVDCPPLALHPHLQHLSTLVYCCQPATSTPSILVRTMRVRSAEKQEQITLSRM